MIDVCTCTTLSGRKVPVLLDEPRVAFNLLIEIITGEQFEPGLAKIAPDNRNAATLRQGTGIHR